jgi:hypothetical protein
LNASSLRCLFLTIELEIGNFGPVVELADTQVLGACAERCAGSSPARASHRCVRALGTFSVGMSTIPAITDSDDISYLHANVKMAMLCVTSSRQNAHATPFQPQSSLGKQPNRF